MINTTNGIARASLLFVTLTLTTLANTPAGLGTLRLKWEEAAIEKGIAHKAQRDSIRLGYSRALKELAERAQSKGNLESYIDARNEMKRFTKHHEVTKNDLELSYPALRSLQELYLKKTKATTKSYRDSMRRIDNQYLSSLVKLQSSLTSQGKIEQALETKQEITNTKQRLLTYTRHPKDAVAFNGHWYKVFPNKTTWQDAKERCEEMDGYLVSITKEEEAEFLVKMVSKGESFWLGGTDERVEGTWEWVSGERFRYHRWYREGDRKEPNNGGPGLEHYLTWHRPTNSWNDAAMREVVGGFICEWEE